MRELWAGEDESPRPLLHGGERPHVHAAGRSDPGHGRSGRARGGQARRQDRRRPRRLSPRRSSSRCSRRRRRGPRYGQLTVCYAESEQEARRTALEIWPNAALKGTLTQELAAPSDFEAAVEMVTEDDVAELVICGPTPSDT